MKDECVEQRAAFRPVVVAPTFNNARTLPDILTRIVATGLPLIVVNDGSVDDTAAVLSSLKYAGEFHCCTHAANRGKASALRTGFTKAIDLGFTHAATIDTDGQLDPEQLPGLIELARANPKALCLGVRDETAVDYPARSRTGRRVSNLLVRIESGLVVRDSQCGLRVYPLGLVRAVKCWTNHFGFETEIITRAGWAGCKTAEFSARCRYLPHGQRISHFRPWIDSLRAVFMHAGLFARALAPWPHPKWPPRPRTPLSFKALREWVSPRSALRQLREDNVSRNAMAAGVAVGVFIANVPIYGFQTVASLYAAKKLHLHPLAVVIGSHASTPPVGPALVIASYFAGHFLLHGVWPSGDWNLVKHGGRAIGPMLLDVSVGGVIVGAVLAILSFFLASALFGALMKRGVENGSNVETPRAIANTKGI